MIKCHIVYLLLRIKSPIANSASDFSIHLLLRNLRPAGSKIRKIPLKNIIYT